MNRSLPTAVAIIALLVVAYQQLTLRRLERVVSGALAAGPRDLDLLELQERLRGLEAQVARLAAAPPVRAQPPLPAAVPPTAPQPPPVVAAPAPAIAPPPAPPADATASPAMQQRLQALRQQNLMTHEGRDRWVAGLSATAHLSPQQALELEAVLSGEYDQHARILARARGGLAIDAVRKEQRQARQQADQQAHAILSTDQYRAYQQRRAMAVPPLAP